jgi:hypothetical protein
MTKATLTKSRGAVPFCLVKKYLFTAVGSDFASLLFTIDLFTALNDSKKFQIQSLT